MKVPRIILDAAIGPPRPIGFRRITHWLTCRITDRPFIGRVIRRSRVTARFQSVISEAACRRDFVSFPVFIPVVRNNRKSGLGTPVTFSNVPHIPVASEKNAVGRIREALAVCNECPKLVECRSVTLDSLRPLSPGFVQGGMVFVSKITDMRKAIAKWNATHPRSLRIPTKGRGAWTLHRTPTKIQLEEYMMDLTTTPDFRAGTLQMAIDSYEDTVAELEDYDPWAWATSDGWDDAVEKHG